VTIVDRLRDPQLYGGLPAFRSLASWGAWLTVLKAIFGLSLDPSELELFSRHTGRSVYAPPSGGWPTVAIITGRQSGKSRVVGLLTTDVAVTSEPEPDGLEVYAALVAQDVRGAVRSLFRYAVAPFDRLPLLSPLVTARTAETLQLNTGTTIAVYPCRPAAIRGIRARIVGVDELAYFTTTDGNPMDTEMLRAVRPTLATTGGKLVILSSPYAESGALWQLYRDHYGREEDRHVLVWQAPAFVMNPTLPESYLTQMREEDPEAYRSEVLGEFRSGVRTLFDAEALEACVDRGVRERLPEVAA
jgi:hypothetical protein